MSRCTLLPLQVRPQGYPFSFPALGMANTWITKQGSGLHSHHCSFSSWPDALACLVVVVPAWQVPLTISLQRSQGGYVVVPKCNSTLRRDRLLTTCSTTDSWYHHLQMLLCWTRRYDVTIRLVFLSVGDCRTLWSWSIPAVLPPQLFNISTLWQVWALPLYRVQ